MALAQLALPVTHFHANCRTKGLQKKRNGNEKRSKQLSRDKLRLLKLPQPTADGQSFAVPSKPMMKLPQSKAKESGGFLHIFVGQINRTTSCSWWSHKFHHEHYSLTHHTFLLHTFRFAWTLPQHCICNIERLLQHSTKDIKRQFFFLFFKSLLCLNLYMYNFIWLTAIIFSNNLYATMQLRIVSYLLIDISVLGTQKLILEQRRLVTSSKH